MNKIFRIFRMLFLVLVILGQKAKADPTIYFGRRASLSESPSSGWFYPPDGQAGKLCGIELLSPHWAMITDHCNYGINPVGYNVVFGDDDLNVVSGKEQYAKVVSTIVMPQRLANGGPTSENDIRWDLALVKLDTSIEFRDGVMPAILTKTTALPGNVQIFGFGTDESGQLTKYLKTAQVDYFATLSDDPVKGPQTFFKWKTGYIGAGDSGSGVRGRFNKDCNSYTISLNSGSTGDVNHFTIGPDLTNSFYYSWIQAQLLENGEQLAVPATFCSYIPLIQQ